MSEVTDELRTRGIDLNNNRFLILQGEVEQISLMKPKALTPHDDGLLEYLEDIIGSNQYVEENQYAVEANQYVRMYDSSQEEAEEPEKEGDTTTPRKRKRGRNAAVE